MGNKFLKLISDFFKVEEKSQENGTIEEVIEQGEVQGRKDENQEHIELSVVIDFVREIEAYYTNELFRQKSNYINDTKLTEDQVVFLKKKIQEYEIAIKLITEIKDKLLERQKECRDLWGKTSYSFYEELEKVKFDDIFNDVFNIVKQIVTINVIPELDKIIMKRLELYKNSWNINCGNLPRSNCLRIIERIGNVETYQFGCFQKKVVDVGYFEELLPEQINAIKKVQIELKFETPVDNVWIRCTTINRKQLEYLKRSTFFENDWEEDMKYDIVYDMVNYCDLESYIRAIMQLLLPRKPYVIISIINPNSDVFQLVKNAIEIQDKKVKVIDRMAFLLPERIGQYGNNLQFECVSRKQNLEKLSFCPFKDFVDNFFVS